MINLALSDGDKREEQVLELALKQCGIDIMFINPSSRFYIKMLQYKPLVVLMEIPKNFMEHLHFVKLVKQHSAMRKTLLIGFGYQLPKDVLAMFGGAGLNVYLVRPLKIGQIFELIEKHTKMKVNNSKSDPATGKPNDFNEDSLFDKNVLPLIKIGSMANLVSKLMAFPFTVPRVLKITSDENAGASELAKVIQGDPVISTQILKVSNAVFFSSLNRRISTIKDAIVRIGFSETKRIVIGMTVMNLLDKETHNAGFDRMEYWLHSLGCAIITERLAKRLGQINPDEAFLAGLICDFGLLLMDEYFPKASKRILESATEHATEFYAEENAAMNINHIDLTVELFEKWKIPELITRAIKSYINYLPTETSSLVPEQKIAVCLCIADYITKALGIGRSCDQFVRPIPNECFNELKMMSGLTQLFIDDVNREIDFYAKFFKIETKSDSRHDISIEDLNKISVTIVNVAGSSFIPPFTFLKRVGVAVTLVNEEAYLSGELSFSDGTMCWCSTETTAEQLVKIGERAFSASVPEGKKKTVLIAFVDENSQLPSDATLSTFIFIPQQIDMRKMERILRDTVDGNRHKFEKYAVTKPAEA